MYMVVVRLGMKCDWIIAYYDMLTNRATFPNMQKITFMSPLNEKDGHSVSELGIKRSNIGMNLQENISQINRLLPQASNSAIKFMLYFRIHQLWMNKNPHDKCLNKI